MRNNVFLALAIFSFIFSAVGFAYGFYLLNTVTTGWESVFGYYPIFFGGIPFAFLGWLFLSLKKKITKGVLVLIVLTFLFLILFWAKPLLTLF